MTSKPYWRNRRTGFLGSDTALTAAVKGFCLPYSLVGGQGACLTDSSSGREHSKMRGATLCPQKVLSTTKIFINLTPISRIYDLFRVWFIIHRNVMQEKQPPFFLFCFVLLCKQKWNRRCRILWEWMCTKCMWSNGYVWCTSWTWKSWNS